MHERMMDKTTQPSDADMINWIGRPIAEESTGSGDPSPRNGLPYDDSWRKPTISFPSSILVGNDMAGICNTEQVGALYVKCTLNTVRSLRW